MRFVKKAVSLLIAGTLIVQTLGMTGAVEASSNGTTTANGEESRLTLKSDSPVTSGVQHRKYEWSSTRSSGNYNTEANVIVIDLHNPYVQLNTMTGRGGALNTKQSVLNMARETQAVAGVNGDFFHLQLNTPPFGPNISGGEWISAATPNNGWYTFGVTADNKPVIDHFTFEGTVTAANGNTHPLAGINRAASWTDSVHSHVRKLHLYTPAWGSSLERGHDSHYTPTEVLVIDDIVAEISIHKPLPVPVPENGYILRGNGNDTVVQFIQENLHIGDSISIDYSMKPSNANDSHISDFQMMIGGHTLLVNDGKASSFTTNVNSIGGNRSRTGVGYSQDSRYVYLITVDNNGPSKGMSLREFQQLMVKLGVWKGMNLDGGGSTTMVSRPLGDTQAHLTNRTEFGGQRSVVNGIGVYTTAPVGDLLGFTITGRTQLFLQEPIAYQLRAYDTYYNPYQADARALNWSTINGSGSFDGNVFTPTSTGQTTIQAANGEVKEQLQVNIVGREQLRSLKIDSQPIVATSIGESFEVPVAITTKQGLSRTISAEALHWEFIDFDGIIEGNRLTITQLPEQGVGKLVASYDGFSTVLDVNVGSTRLFADFDTVTHPITHRVYPSEVTGEAWIAQGFPDRDDDDNALIITYNFTEGTGNKASYAEFNGTQGVKIEGEPTRMNLNVIGDNSGNWLRMEAWDRDGDLQRIDIDRNVNWHGWKPVSVDLRSYNLKFPITLRHIYTASPAQGQDERPKVGQMAIDDITFDYLNRRPEPELKKIQLTVGQKYLTVNGQTMELDQEPILEKGTTLVPIRFIVDALGGQVDWDDQERKVTVIRGGDRAELWIDNPDINVNGEVTASLLPPRIVNRRTMVPLRVLTEQLGWKVTWDQETQTVTLE